jgi:hypothetical protein
VSSRFCSCLCLSSGLQWNSPASAAILPSALLHERIFRSVPLGPSRFSRCCYLRIGLGFPACAGKLSRDLARSHLNSAVPVCRTLVSSLVSLSVVFVRPSPHPLRPVIGGSISQVHSDRQLLPLENLPPSRCYSATLFHKLVSFPLRLERVNRWERIASRRRPALSSICEVRLSECAFFSTDSTRITLLRVHLQDHQMGNRMKAVGRDRRDTLRHRK